MKRFDIQNHAYRIALVLLAASIVVSCGRRGRPEAPPSASVIIADENGEVIETEEKEDNPFILDPLL